MCDKVLNMNGDKLNVVKKRNYIVSSFANDKFKLILENFSDKKFVPGDIIEFEFVESKKFGKIFTNVQKIDNIHLKELKKSFENNNIVRGYVYEKNEHGYLVSFKGYKCLLPNKLSIYKIPRTFDDILNTYQFFNVMSIKNDIIVLTRIPILKEKLSIMQVIELSGLETGFTFVGKVKSVKGYGVFIYYKYTEGLLHINKILNTSLELLTRDENKSLELILKKVFAKGREVVVKIDEINNKQYNLNWDKDVETNKEICIELNKNGI